MAIRIPLDKAHELNLPGRRSREIMSGRLGADSSIRMVEIAVPAPGEPRRAPHWHPDSEECIHVMSGQGVTWVDGQDFPMAPGDTIRVGPGEKHVTRNTGDSTLILLCFFPAPEISLMMETEVSDES